MMRIVLVISILLLSSCGYHKCIKPKDMLYDEYSNVVVAGIKKGEKEHVTWVKSDLILAGSVSLDISVSTVNINFCSNDKKTINVFVNDETKSSDVKKFYLDFKNIMPKDKLSFRVVPKFEFTVNKDICENKDSRIYVQDKDKCMETYFGENHYITFDNNNAQMNNMMYLNRTRVELQKKEEAKEKGGWINFPSRILYNIDSNTYNKLLDTIGKYSNTNDQSNQGLGSEEMSVLCQVSDKSESKIEGKDQDSIRKNIKSCMMHIL